MVVSGSVQRMGALVVAAACVTALVGGSPSFAATAPASCQPAIQDLGDPFGGHFSFADGVNASGAVAGSAFLRSGLGRAVVWSGGHATNLGVVAPYDESFAHDIGNDGTVVGELNFKGRLAAPFSYDHGTMRLLPGLGGTFGYASAINKRGVIVGTASDASGFPHAVLWTHGGDRVHDLGIAPGDESSFGSGISDANIVAGDSDDADGNERPAVFVHRHVVVLSASASRFGAAEDINVTGRVVGLAFLPSDEQHAMTWGPWKARGRDLGTLPGGSRASLVDIDNLGRAVGGGNLGVNPDQNHAVFWRGTGPLLALRPLSGHFVHDFAVARNLGARGEAVGGSQNASGEVRATVWTCAAQQAFLPTEEIGPVVPAGPGVVTLPPGVTR
jgi:probable HAF family extracellular repeat protein